MAAKFEELVFTQLCEGKITQDEEFDFSVLGSTNNRLALCGSTEQIITGELVLETNSIQVLPYLFAVLNVSQERPVTKLIETIELPRLYRKSNVLERQELALEPFYTTHLAELPLIAHLTHVEWAPRLLNGRHQLLCVLTTYGACKIYMKLPRVRVWNNEHADLAAVLQDTLWQSENFSKVKNFKDFQAHVDAVWITAFCWNDSLQPLHIIYIATATGEILAYSFDDCIDSEIKLYAQLSTDLQRITYLKAFGNNFLLASNVQGVVQLFKIKHQQPAVEAAITADMLLWRQMDRLFCRQALITQNDEHYYIVFSKAAHVVVYCLCRETGALKARARTTLDVVKITAIEVISTHEFIIGGFYCELYYLHISHAENGKLQLEVCEMKTKGINRNFVHLKGIAASDNHNLFTLVCDVLRNDLKVLTKRTKLIVCGLQPSQPLVKLSQNIKQPLDVYLDYAVELHFNINNQIDLSSYQQYMSINNQSTLQQFNADALKALQLKLLIWRSYQFVEKNKSQTFGCLANNVEVSYLMQMIKIVSYILRIRYLATIENLNEFQTKAAICLVTSSHILLQDIANQPPKDNKEPLVQRLGFVTAANECLTNLETDLRLNEKLLNYNDVCSFCNETINMETLCCKYDHAVFRCCISQMQVPLHNERYCLQCNVPALDSDAELQQLLAPDEHIRCALCRFSFTKF